MDTVAPDAPQRLDDRAVAVITTDGTAWTWDDLDHEFTPAIIAYARSRGVTAHEDIAQDVLLAAVEQLDRFDGDDAALRSWLFTIAFRRITDQHRDRYRRPEQLVADQDPLPCVATSTEEHVIDAADVDAVLAAFDVLTSRERSVLERRIIQDVPIAEIAEQLGLRRGHVRVIQTRALAKLRRRLQADDQRLGPTLAALALSPTQLRAAVGPQVAAPAGSTPVAAGSTPVAAASGAGLVAEIGIGS